MKWVLIGIFAVIGYSVVNAMSGPAMRDFDSASLKIAMGDRNKVVVVEYYSDT